MRASPEPTQLEHLSDASFLGKLLVFTANVRLDWKVIASYKHTSLFGLINSDEGKQFYNSGHQVEVCAADFDKERVVDVDDVAAAAFRTL